MFVEYNGALQLRQHIHIQVTCTKHVASWWFIANHHEPWLQSQYVDIAEESGRLYKFCLELDYMVDMKFAYNKDTLQERYTYILGEFALTRKFVVSWGWTLFLQDSFCYHMPLGFIV